MSEPSPACFAYHRWGFSVWNRIPQHLNRGTCRTQPKLPGEMSGWNDFLSLRWQVSVCVPSVSSVGVRLDCEWLSSRCLCRGEAGAARAAAFCGTGVLELSLGQGRRDLVALMCYRVWTKDKGKVTAERPVGLCQHSSSRMQQSLFA